MNIQHIVLLHFANFKGAYVIAYMYPGRVGGGEK